MMRRKQTALLFAALIGLAPIGAYAQRQSSAVATADVRELPADQQIIQALNRLTFGARPGDVQRVRSIGLDKWIDLQLHPERINDNRINTFVAQYPALNAEQNDLVR